MASQQLVRVRFLKGKVYGGEIHEPGDEAAVEEGWARRWYATGCVEILDGHLATPGPLSTEAVLGRPARAETRDPVSAEAQVRGPRRRGRG